MMRSKGIAPENTRPLKAATAVLVILLVVPGVDAVVRFITSSEAADATSIGLNSAFLTGAADAYASLERIEDAAASTDADIPEVFSDEIGFLPGAHDIRVNGGGSIVGYAVTLDSGDALNQLTTHMEERGWKAVSLGEVEGATFVKATGLYTWSLATCTQVGSSTSIVLRSVFE